MALKRDLSFFDLTSIVVGAVVGADIYIASSLTAGLVGPLSLVAWIVAGLFALCLALVFAYCSYYVPRVGGPFAFVSTAFDDFWGFIAGWSLWIAEMLALPIFAIAFVQYLEYFVLFSFTEQVVIKALFLFALTGVNIRGVKAAGVVNDVLTLVKLVPLLMLVVGGLFVLLLHPRMAADHYLPLAPLGFGQFNTAVVLIFWAYVGFELGTLPAGEVKDPKHTIPKAITLGMAIVMLFYLSTNFVIFGTVPWTILASSTIPLVLVAEVILGSAGALVISLGALVSVAGSDESGVLGTARLSYAMAIDGLFPAVFAKVHPRYGTPSYALLIQGIMAFLLSIHSGIASLITFSVFTMAFSFLLTCISLLVLKRNRETSLHGQHVLPYLGIAICLYLMASASPMNMVVGFAVILAGIPIYTYFSPKVDMHDLKRLFTSEEAILVRRLRKRERFLANFVLLIHRLTRYFRGRMRKKQRTDDG
jgi:amino acid transporter